MMFLAGLIAFAPVFLQVGPPPSMPPPPEQSASDEIVVTGLPDIDDAKSAVTTGTLGSLRTGDAVSSRTTFDLTQRWAACAADRKSSARPDWVRQAVDSRTNSNRQALAMQQLARLSASCAPDAHNALDGIITDPYYDRGALMIEILKRTVPKLALTKTQTSDPAVQAKFNGREIPLAKFRLPVDRQYFEAAICFVRLQPELAVRLALTDKPLDATRRLEAAIVNRAKVCVGNARRVYFDGIQFRFYIADAVYRWTVAARGTDTLIVDGNGRH